VEILMTAACDATLRANVETFERLLKQFDVQLKCPDYASGDRLSGKQKKYDEKISRAVAKLSIFFNGLGEENYEKFCLLAGRNKSGKHDPLNHWWQSFSCEIRDTCHNKLAKEGRELVEIMKQNLQR
jgi:hypothetical protein